MSRKPTVTKTKILDTAVKVIRTKGYSATTVDDLCSAAGVTKGAFFHYFSNKEQLARESADRFSEMAEGLFGSAPYRQLDDPVARLLGYVDFRIGILCGEIPEFTCLLGTMVQEVYISRPDIREVCRAHMDEHISFLVDDIKEALSARSETFDWTPESLGYHIQSVIQGAFIFVKATGDVSIALESLKHLRRYLEYLFQPGHDLLSTLTHEKETLT